jgi:hypothetical protein
MNGVSAILWIDLVVLHLCRTTGVPLAASLGRRSNDGGRDEDGAIRVALGVGFGRVQTIVLFVVCWLEAVHSSHACWGLVRGSTSRRATNLCPVAFLQGVSLLEAKVLRERVGGLVVSSTEGTVELGARSSGNARIGRRSGATMWKIVSQETTFKGGEHHTSGTGGED